LTELQEIWILLNCIDKLGGDPKLTAIARHYLHIALTAEENRWARAQMLFWGKPPGDYWEFQGWKADEHN